jgi:hypothetical protein
MAGQSLWIAVGLIGFWTRMMIVTVSGQEVPSDNNFCNICGEGNTIQFPTGVVDFTYDGEYRKNNCRTWQQIVNNNNFAIPDAFCRTQMLEYTHKVCRCTRPDGSAVEWVAPTPAPTNSSAALALTTLAPTRGAEQGIGAPTELPLEWDVAAPSSSSSPAPMGVIPTVVVSIGTTVMPNGGSVLSVDAPTLSPTSKKKPEVDRPDETSGLPQFRSVNRRIVIVLIFVESLLPFFI